MLKLAPTSYWHFTCQDGLWNALAHSWNVTLINYSPPVTVCLLITPTVLGMTITNEAR